MLLNYPFLRSGSVSEYMIGQNYVAVVMKVKKEISHSAVFLFYVKKIMLSKILVVIESKFLSVGIYR